jgi:putative acetyltransferase
MIIRTENETDREAVYDINALAFETEAEAKLVDILREHVHPILSLVAEIDGIIVGHIMFSPVSLGEHTELQLMGLAPMAVSPEHQRKGIGSALARAGIKECRRTGCDALVVLGHPAFYPRFGFSPSTSFGINSEYDVPEDVFMVLELVPGALSGKPGQIKFPGAFGSV